MVKKVAYHSCGDIRSVWWTRISFEGDGLSRGSLFGRLLSRAWSCAAAEKGNVWGFHCVRPAESLAKRNAELSEYVIDAWKTVMGDLRAGKGLIVMRCILILLSEKKSMFEGWSSYLCQACIEIIPDQIYANIR